MDEILININLQLFASPEDEGRTEEPTEKKLREAREKGKVAKTVELSSALILLTTLFLIAILYKYLILDFVQYMKSIFSNIDKIDFTYGNINRIISAGFIQFLKMSVPVLIISVISAFFADFLQVGFQFSFYPLQPDFSKISFTFEKLMNRVLFSREVLVNFLKSVLKVGIIIFVAILVIKSDYPKIAVSINLNLTEAIKLTLWSTFKLGMWTAIILLIFSIFDYLYQRWAHIQSLKMTIQEFKEELKQYEGDPHIKARQRERHRQLAMRRMMQQVPKADVVVTNPTHIAVALLYEPEYMNAAEVIAKGADFLAKKIIEIAKANNVPIVEDRPLARMLYEQVEVGDEIPPVLFEAVANLLAKVYEMRKKEAV
jgi:flagellar biosynthetic protein FlhB